MRTVSTMVRCRLPAKFSGPRLSDNLESAIERYLNPLPGVDPGPVPAAISQEAARHLLEYNNLCRPATADTIVTWLAAIAPAVRIPPDASTFRFRATAIMQASEHMPGAVFNADTQREAIATFKWFPSAADVIELLEGDRIWLQSRERALKGLATACAPTEEPPKAPSDEEREAIVANFHREFEDAVAPARKMGRCADTSSASHLTPDQLAETYRRDREIKAGIPERKVWRVRRGRRWIYRAL